MELYRFLWFGMVLYGFLWFGMDWTGLVGLCIGALCGHTWQWQCQPFLKFS